MTSDQTITVFRIHDHRNFGNSDFNLFANVKYAHTIRSNVRRRCRSAYYASAYVYVHFAALAGHMHTILGSDY